MSIEQLPPNRPNFKLILYLTCAAILVLFVAALAFLHFGRNHFTMGLTKNTSITMPLAPQHPPARAYRSSPV